MGFVHPTLLHPGEQKRRQAGDNATGDQPRIAVAQFDPVLACFYGQSEKTHVRANYWHRLPILKRAPAGIEGGLQN